ncbi:MAG: hypothetical protein OHK0017_09860 [Patescibacteria group bacterium]
MTSNPADKTQTKDKLKKFTDKVYATLMKPNRWYTGTPIKSWIRLNLFLSGMGLNLNYNLQTNQWSAYCHFSAAIALQNIIGKLNLVRGSNVVVHPLLDQSLVEVIINCGLNPVLIDIDKASLEINLEAFKTVLGNVRIEAVFLQNINGVNRDNFNILDLCYPKQIEVVYISQNEEITTESLKIMIHAGCTAVIKKTKTWFPHVVNDLTPSIQIHEDEFWYVSWFLENRIVSSNESHLTESQDNFQGFLEKIYYLEMQKLKKLDWTANFVSLMANYTLYKNKLDKLKPLEIEQQIIQDWAIIQKYAIPDLAFELDEADSGKTLDEKTEDLVNQIHTRQNNAKRLYNYFLGQINFQPVNSMEIPVYFLDLTYTTYHFYSLNRDAWLNSLQQTGFNTYKLDRIHPLVINKFNELPNTALLVNYGVLIYVPSYPLNLQ